MKTARPTLSRSVPFWFLVVLSLAAIAFGGWLAQSRIARMNAALAAETATLVDVYSNQSYAFVGAVVLGAGMVGILLALTVASARALVRPSGPRSRSLAAETGLRNAAPTVPTSPAVPTATATPAAGPPPATDRPLA